ncbi:cytochrome c oxidase assembly protein subunit 15 [Deinococcus metalli]|uniref:Cytochrome c oxidase assembly protein subunit 15 n=1 Tax=Deinococcus metalli TaxID=1141878 RepID=A0A7W8KH02_9DEIO|nr:COX15/CtaA family protein [Deinococcus metalli]MBB5376973.1 cytochrome c oxidase assembly protein subunit 15 [Deinococcus metalli]GHF46727.1 heme A synthase [Deinococcus metalli]
MSGTLTAARAGAGVWLPRLAWAALAYNVLVILWGAVVRLTTSGAGCGAHWPLCNGVVLPPSPTLHTVIEFSHRLTSGASGLLAIALVVLAFRVTPKGHPARLGAALSLGLIVLEGLVGGVQVLLGLTATSTDPARGFVQGVHLANTFALLGALLLTALWASGAPAVRLRRQGRAGTLGYVALALLLLLGMAGAVTALGDLLFLPADGTPIDTVKHDYAATANVLQNLRVIHPMLAIVVSAFLVWLAAWFRRERPSPGVERWSVAVWGLIAAQLVLGFLNVALRAPAWLQLSHLALACALWLATLTLVYFALTALTVQGAPRTVAGRVGA